VNVTETPEEKTRWRVGHILYLLRRAGLPLYDRDFMATSPLADPVRQAGFLVSSRPGDHDCVYAEWIEHWLARGEKWRYGTRRIISSLEAEGYAGELLTEPSMNGYIRVTRPDHGSEGDGDG
jgi:hypothetical protein